MSPERPPRDVPASVRARLRDLARRRNLDFTLLLAHHQDSARRERWRVLHRQIPTGADGPARLADAGVELSRFPGPLCDSLIEGTAFPQTWPASGPGRPAVEARTGGGRGD